MAIRFINTKALTTELARDQVGEKSMFQYFLANSLLGTILLYYAIIFGANINWMFLIEVVVVVLITVHGLLKAFDANGGSNGKNFLVRATCLAFPIGFKVNLASFMLELIVSYIFPFVIDPSSFRNPERVYDLVIFIWAPAFTAIFFWRLTVHLREIQKVNDT